jgi:hypothetical protein
MNKLIDKKRFFEAASASLSAPLLVATISIGISAQAAEPTPAQIEQLRSQLNERFTKADVNKDGKLSKEEAKGKMPRVYDNFEKIDVAKKGYVTQQQIMDYASAEAAKRK